MKKLLLSISIAAFLASGSMAATFTSTTNEATIIVQDVKKKAKATKKKGCDEKKLSATNCNGGKHGSKKDCCSHQKTVQKESKLQKTDPKKK